MKRLEEACESDFEALVGAGEALVFLDGRKQLNAFEGAGNQPPRRFDHLVHVPHPSDPRHLLPPRTAAIPSLRFARLFPRHLPAGEEAPGGGRPQKRGGGASPDRGDRCEKHTFGWSSHWYKVSGERFLGAIHNTSKQQTSIMLCWHEMAEMVSALA